MATRQEGIGPNPTAEAGALPARVRSSWANQLIPIVSARAYPHRPARTAKPHLSPSITPIVAPIRRQRS